MSLVYEEIEQSAGQLTIGQKAALAQTLLKDLDQEEAEDVEDLWIAEAEQRYEAYLRGEMEALPGDEVMARVRYRLR